MNQPSVPNIQYYYVLFPVLPMEHEAQWILGQKSSTTEKHSQLMALITFTSQKSQ